MAAEKKVSKSKPFCNPLAKALPAYQEALEETKRMTREQIDADWDAKQAQRRASGTNIHVPTLYLISRDGKVVRI
jgi:hypothetical protein